MQREKTKEKHVYENISQKQITEKDDLFVLPNISQTEKKISSSGHNKSFKLEFKADLSKIQISNSKNFSNLSFSKNDVKKFKESIGKSTLIPPKFLKDD